MKKLQPIYALILTLFLLYAFSGNPPDQNTGAPGEGNCTSCHTPNNSGFEGDVVIRGLPDTIISGITYQVSVATRVTAGSPSRAGFQMVILDDAGDNTGNFDNEGANSGLISDGGRTYFEHRGSPSFSGTDSVEWTVEWTAPTMLPNDSIRLYINSIIGNGSGSAGDLMVSSQPVYAFQAPMAAPLEIEVVETIDVSCFDGTDGAITVSATGGTGTIDFAWTTGATTATITNLAFGTYEVTATDEAGVSTTASVTVDQPDLLEVSISDHTNINCINLTGSAMAVATGGTGPYSLNWSNGTEGDSADLPAGTHQVTVTDANQCTASTEVLIEEDANDPVAIAGDDLAITCNDNPSDIIQLNGSGSSTGTEITYQWITSTGNIVAGENGLMPEINAAGSYLLSVMNNNNGCEAMDSVLVFYDTIAPIASAGADQQLDCDQTSVTLDGSASSSGSEINYTWTSSAGNIISGENSQTPAVNAAGTYRLTVSNTSNGCSSVDSAMVTIDATLPMVTISGEMLLSCENDTIQLTGNSTMSEHVTFLWRSPDGIILGDSTMLQVAVLGAGTYELIATDTSNNCSSIATFTALPPEMPMADAGNDASLDCLNNRLFLDGSNSMGENLSFEWTTQDGNIVAGATSISPEVNKPGTYILVVRDTLTGCTSTTDMVEIAEMSTSDLFAASGDAEQLTCAQMSLMLQASASEGENIVYEWTTEDGNILEGGETLTPTIDAPGTYILTVRDTTNGCSAISSIGIAQDDTPPVISAGDSMTLGCELTSVVLNASSDTEYNLTYSWTTDGGNIVSGQNSLNPEVDAPGTYTLMVVDTFTNCSVSASVNIRGINDLPLADAGFDQQLDCVNDTVMLAGGGSMGAHIFIGWTTEGGNILEGLNTYTPLVDAPGTYSLVVTDTITGCSTTADVEVISNTVKPLAEAGPIQQYICGDTPLAIQANVDGGDQFTYFWCTPDGEILSGAESTDVIITGAGFFEFIVTNTDNGCKSIDTVFVSAVEGITLALDTLLAGAATVSASGGMAPYSYIWNTENQDTTSSVSGLQAGTYLVSASDTNGCADSLSVTIELSTSAFEQESRIEEVRLFPNPVTTRFELTADLQRSVSAEVGIFNQLGQNLWERSYTGPVIRAQIETDQWEAGLYFLQIRSGNNFITREFVVMK